jgi:nucleobase:cation symporter-1, NCS1 family
MEPRSSSVTADGARTSAGQSGLEQHSIEPIPAGERTAKARDQFTLWFGWNMSPSTFIVGALATGVFHLPYGIAVLSLSLGIALGGFAAGLHAAQGARLGVPQMLQARGQFGGYGAVLLVVLAFVMFVGFFAANLVISGQAAADAVRGTSVDLVIVLATILSVVLTVFGYRVVQRANAWTGYVVAPLSVIAAIAVIAKGDVTAHLLSAGSVSATAFFSVFALGAVWTVSIAPYVSDYTRYLPENASAARAFAGTYWGMVASSVILMAIGALIGSVSAMSDSMAGLHSLLGWYGLLVLIAFAVSCTISNAVNAYSSVLTTFTSAETFRHGRIPGLRARLLCAGGINVLGLVIALAGQGNFLTNFTNFVTILLYALIPWSAINLVDYYLIRRGSYDVAAFYRADFGPYRRINWPAMAIYVVGVGLEVPFWSTALYTGPVATAMGGVDVAWLVGFVASGALYWAASQFLRRSQAAPLAAASS